MEPIQTQDELLRVYSKVLGIQSNIDPKGIVLRETGKEYDSLIDRASIALKNDLSEFKIEDAYLTPDGKYYRGGQFKGRIEALLLYLRAFIPADTVKRIGFITS